MVTRIYLFPLRPNLDIELQLPTDLTRPEVERLKAFMQTLILPEGKFGDQDDLNTIAGANPA